MVARRFLALVTLALGITMVITMACDESYHYVPLPSDQGCPLPLGSMLEVPAPGLNGIVLTPARNWFSRLTKDTAITGAFFGIVTVACSEVPTSRSSWRSIRGATFFDTMLKPVMMIINRPPSTVFGRR